jgi:ATP-binding cassette subfamily C protein
VKASTKKYFTRLWNFSGGRLAVLAAMAVLAAALEGAALLLLVPLFQSVKGVPVDQSIYIPLLGTLFDSIKNRDHVLLAALGLFALFSVAQEYVKRWSAVFSTGIKAGFVRELGDNLYAAFALAGWRALLLRRKSDVANALSNELKMIDMGTQIMIQLAETVPMVLIQAGICAFISPLGTLGAVTVGGLFFAVMRPVNRKLGGLGEMMNSLMKDNLADVFEHLNGIKEVKSYGAERAHIARFEEKNRGTQDNYVNFIKLFSGTSFIYNSATMLLMAAFFFLAVTVFNIGIVKLIVIFIIFMRIWPVFYGYQVSMQMLMLMFPAWESFSTALDELRAAREEPPAAADGRKLALSRLIELKNISFAYEEGRAPALCDISLRIPANTSLAVTGPSGSGKSTLVDILIGLLHPDAGEVFVDDTAIDAQAIACWRGMIGFVPQETFLFRGTVRDNLLWSKPSASEAELWEALDCAAADFVRAMPKGLDSELGDRGVRMSGGERQRIALARALLRKPALLILDEATSSVDTETERRICSALEKLRGRMTIVTIAHRLSTIKTADRIVVIENGRLVEEGTFDELASRAGGRFAGLAGTGQ